MLWGLRVGRSPQGARPTNGRTFIRRNTQLFTNPDGSWGSSGRTDAGGERERGRPQGTFCLVWVFSLSKPRRSPAAGPGWGPRGLRAAPGATPLRAPAVLGSLHPSASPSGKGKRSWGRSVPAPAPSRCSWKCPQPPRRLSPSQHSPCGAGAGAAPGTHDEHRAGCPGAFPCSGRLRGRPRLKGPPQVSALCRSSAFKAIPAAPAPRL